MGFAPPSTFSTFGRSVGGNGDSQIAQTGQERERNRRAGAILSSCKLFIISGLSRYCLFPFNEVEFSVAGLFRGVEDRMPKACTIPARARSSELDGSEICDATGSRGQTIGASFRSKTAGHDHLHGLL
jgi:hypothetical protein